MNQYDEQIKYLTDCPSGITLEWACAKGLFKFVGEDCIGTGCLTMIRDNPRERKAFIKGIQNDELTVEIANDERIPKKYWDITVEHLPVFKEWQERIDLMQKT